MSSGEFATVSRSPVSGPGALRNAVAFGRDPLGFLDGLRGGQPGDGFVRARFGVGPSLLFVTDPDLIQQVLVDDTDRYWRPDILSSRTEALTANGLIQSDGDLWNAQRSRLQPLFGGDRLQQYGTLVSTVTEEVLDGWTDGQQVDLYRESARITVRVIAEGLLGMELDDSDIEQIRHTGQAVADEFTISPITLARQLLPTPPSREYRDAIEEMHAWADERIADRRGDADDSLVGVMLAAERDPESDVDHELVRDELLTFLFAGYETTALTLSFALWYVSRRPDLARQLREEGDAVETAHPGPSTLASMSCARRVVRETLRLRPASWGVFREAQTRSRLGDAVVGRGDYLMLPQWTLHRDARFFERPETFAPERWRDIELNGTPAYFPFGAGPQSCIGGRLAELEATYVLSRVCREFDIKTHTEAVDDLQPAGVLRPHDGVPARVTQL